MDRDYTPVSLFISVALHAFLLIFVALMSGSGKGEGDGRGEPGPVGNIVSIEFVVPKERQQQPIVKSDIVVKRQLPKPKNRLKPKKTIKPEECKLFFGGIGVNYNAFDNSTTGVHAGYPAEEAGILVGDIVTPVGQKDIRGEIGTSVELKVIRRRQVFYTTVIRAKICMDKL